MTTEPGRALLRHTVATVAYRGAKALRGAPPGFGEFKLGPDTRTPAEIVAHMADLFEWAAHLAQGRNVWKSDPPAGWEAEAKRFFEAVGKFDALLAGDAPLAGEPGRVFSGPIADALTHIGQLNLLRRRAGSPVRGENYSRADIQPGRVGPEQASPTVEFD